MTTNPIQTFQTHHQALQNLFQQSENDKNKFEIDNRKLKNDIDKLKIENDQQTANFKEIYNSDQEVKKKLKHENLELKCKNLALEDDLKKAKVEVEDLKCDKLKLEASLEDTLKKSESERELWEAKFDSQKNEIEFLKSELEAKDDLQKEEKVLNKEEDDQKQEQKPEKTDVEEKTRQDSGIADLSKSQENIVLIPDATIIEPAPVSLDQEITKPLTMNDEKEVNTPLPEIEVETIVELTGDGNDDTKVDNGPIPNEVFVEMSSCQDILGENQLKIVEEQVENLPEVTVIEPEA